LKVLFHSYKDISSIKRKTSPLNIFKTHVPNDKKIQEIGQPLRTVLNKLYVKGLYSAFSKLKSFKKLTDTLKNH
jgi:hypothetical protein